MNMPANVTGTPRSGAADGASTGTATIASAVSDWIASMASRGSETSSHSEGARQRQAREGREL